MKNLFITLLLLLGVQPLFALPEEPVHLEVISRIRHEGLNNSQVMEVLRHLTDVHGPRLTNSPGFFAAANWAKDKLSEWGLQNSTLESWGTFGRGWSTSKYRVEVTAPFYLNVFAYPKAWTPGTDGAVSGTPLLMEYDDADDLDAFEGKTDGAIVLLGSERDMDDHYEADASRHSEEDLAELRQAPDPSAQSPRSERWARYRAIRTKRRKIMKFLKDRGAAVILEASRIDNGTLQVVGGGSSTLAGDDALPQLVIAKEHFNRLHRLLKDNPQGLAMSVEVENHFHTEDTLGYNVIAELPGSDGRLKNEVVMLGAHIDSWHAGTGTTDNGAGSAVMMEAMRILKAIDARPRRTVRLGLWSGEEQGLKGSRGYVARHFGDPATNGVTKQHERFSAYYNLDNGAGKIRGIYLQGNAAARPILEAWLAPFADMDVTTVTIRSTGGTDHLAFDAVGLPGFQFIQDPLMYFSRTWHTNMDVYDHAEEGDLMQMAVVVAAVVYHTAQRPEKMPRKNFAD